MIPIGSQPNRAKRPMMICKDLGCHITHSRPENPGKSCNYSSVENAADESAFSSDVAIASSKSGVISSDDLRTDIMIMRPTE